MSAILSYIVPWLRGNGRTITRSLSQKFPPVVHKILEDHYLKKFEEFFVIGDIHGCYDELVMLLEKANAMKDSILKIYVGDLVTKGPKNQDVVSLLRNSSSTLAVRGNNDEKVVKEYYAAQKPGYNCINPDNRWIKHMPQEDVDYLSNLPYTIFIPHLKAIIVHAGLMPGTPLDANDPQTIITMRNLVETETGLIAMEDAKEGKPWASLWSGPNHVYFGHDARRQLQQYPYATGLDTGCLYGGCLTGKFIKGPRSGLFVTVNALHMYRGR